MTSDSEMMFTRHFFYQMKKGIYHLIINLPMDTIIDVGKLGRFKFQAGYYVYTGSAMNGLESRLARHKKKKKRLHWHIDHLLEHANIIDILTYETDSPLECYFNKKIMSIKGCQIPVKGFGSSDCDCVSHLAFFEDIPNMEDI